MWKLLTALTGILLLAGCASTPAAEPGEDDGPEGSEDPRPDLPKNFTRDVAVTGGFDAAAQTTLGDCSLEPWCFGYPFTVEATATLHAELTWDLDASDFDIILLRDGEEVARADGRPPATLEVLDAELEAGDHEIVVVPYAVAHDEAVFDVVFAPAGLSAEESHRRV